MNDGDREIIDHFVWVREQTLELLALAGVAPQLAQRIMRHADYARH